MKKIITHVAVLIVGILIGNLAFYTWTQISSPEAPRNTAYTQYGQSNEMTYRVFLMIADIPGTSQDATHTNEIEILEYFWGETSDANAIFNAMGPTKPAKEDFRFVFWWDDKASPRLLKSCTMGEIIEHAILYMRLSGMQEDLLWVRLDEVVVSSFGTESNVFEGSKPLCEISLAFNVLSFEAYTFSSDGMRAPVLEFRWDYRSNQP